MKSLSSEHRIPVISGMSGRYKSDDLLSTLSQSYRNVPIQVKQFPHDVPMQAIGQFMHKANLKEDRNYVKWP